MNRSYDEYNYTLSKRELEELKFLFISDDVDYNDTAMGLLSCSLQSKVLTLLSRTAFSSPTNEVLISSNGSSLKAQM